jgi:hypothetical protein
MLPVGDLQQELNLISSYHPRLILWASVAPKFAKQRELNCIGIGISRSSRHKRSSTGAQRAHYRKKRKFELGRQPANTKLGPKRIHTVRVRGGNTKFRALRLDSGNFAWGSEHVTKKTRIIGVVRVGSTALGPVLLDMLPGIQCIQQRASSNEHSCEGCHHTSGCYSIPTVV